MYPLSTIYQLSTMKRADGVFLIMVQYHARTFMPAVKSIKTQTCGFLSHCARFFVFCFVLVLVFVFVRHRDLTSTGCRWRDVCLRR